MANKITGSTDTSGALTTTPTISKSVLVVSKVSGTQTNRVDANKIFQIVGTADAVAAFGADNKLASQITKILIANGVDNIKGIIVASGEVGTELADALEVSLQDKSIKCIITDKNDESTITAVKDHLTVAESNDLFRYSSFAPDNTVTTQSDLIAFAKKIDSDRIFVPGQAFMSGENKVDPQLTATGLIATIMTETSDPALPMNGVQIAGFSGLSKVMLDAEMKALVNGGVTPFYEESGSTNPTIYRLVTSNTTDKVWQEGSTRFIADHVLESVETMLRANYKRTKNVDRILKAIRGDVKIVLETLESLEIIENFDESTLTVAKDPDDMYGALVDYEFDVVTPLYTITINQHLKI